MRLHIWRRLVTALGVLVAVCFGASDCRATFHLMQVEQIIGGINGDTTAQAIQLRMRSAGQNLVAQGRVRVWDAAGLNPIMIVDMGANVPNGLAGDRVLIASAAFLAKTAPTAVADFAMTNLIPASYLAAGRLTFEADNGSILWSIAWGGASYTGSNSGTMVNDSNGNFAPPFAGPCPSTGQQALLFLGSATALSTTNAADYALTPGAAVFTNNARVAFTVNPPCAPPTIQGQPMPPDLSYVGDLVTFDVTASGDPTLSYSWRKDEVPLVDDPPRVVGSNTSQLMITSAELGDTGSYDVVITNGCGNKTSDPASLVVFCPADFDLNQFVNGDDFDGFMWAFFFGDIAADFDHNTFVNGDDFDGFMWAFFVGC